MMTNNSHRFISLLKGMHGSVCPFKQLCTAAPTVVTEKRREKKQRKVIYVKGKTFVDWKKVHLVGGTGGSGCASFMNARSKKGGPYGGDGGRGGDILAMADENLTQLNHLKGHYNALSGGGGKSAWKKGKDGKNITITVPVGTTITNMDTDVVMADLVEQGQLVTLVHGGEGGLGNEHFKSSDHVRPQEFSLGSPGEQCLVEIELKSIADIGLVGFPNAGKSTLLHAITRASPKVADYPFTTLKPNLGVIQYDNNVNISVADIPGLIEGAHKNKGLGHIFLRHVERCRGLIYVVDVVNNDPLKHFNILKNELEMYQTDLSMLPTLFVANKLDLLQDNIKIIQQIQCAIDIPVVGISAKYGHNIENLKSMILDLQ